MIRKIAARPFSAGVQFARPIRPPGFTTRASSRSRLVVGREHDAAGRGHHVEGAVVELEVLAVPDAIVDVEPALSCAFFAVSMSAGARRR